MRTICTMMVTALFLLPAAAHAVTVGCAGATGTFDFNSISAAVNVVPDGSQINVSGTCSEFVFVFNRHGLTIKGVTNPATLQPDPAVPSPGMLLNISSSDGIRIQNMVLSGSAQIPCAHIEDSIVTLQGVTVQGSSGGPGLFVQGHSNLKVTASIVQDNLVGIRLDGGSLLLLGETVPNDPVPSVVQRSSFSGVWIRPGAHAAILGSTIVQNNNIGVNVEGGSADICCDGTDQRKIINNQVGVRVSRGTLEFRGPTLIANNTVFGVRMLGSAATFFGSQTVRGNGAGISVQGSSNIDLFSTEVSSNLGSGVILQDNSSGRFSGNTITGNSGVGITLTAISTAQIFGDNTVSGNGGVDLTCSSDSFGHGDATGIRKVFCPRFNVEPLPGPAK